MPRKAIWLNNGEIILIIGALSARLANERRDADPNPVHRTERLLDRLTARLVRKPHDEESQ